MLVIFAAACVTVVLSIVLYQRTKHKECSSLARLDGKTALVTGGTAGMGLQVATELARRGARVLVCGPCAQEGRAASESIARAAGSRRVHYRVLDLAELASVRRLAAALLAEEDALHLLVNNAGVGGPGGRTTSDHMDEIMQVNYFGAFLLTLLLLPLLRKSARPDDPSRVVNVASGLHYVGKVDIDNLGKTIASSIRAYSNSKLCLVMFSRELAKRLRGKHVVVNSLEPGVVGTQIYDTWNGWVGFLLSWIARWTCKTPWQGAQTTLHVALDDAAGSVSGEYFAECNVTKALEKAHDEDLSARLWDESIKLVKLNPEEVKCGIS